MMFGVFAAGSMALWAGCATETEKQNPDAEVAVIMGRMAAEREVCFLVMGAVNEVLLNL